MKIAFSGESLILLRITYTNCPTVKSDGTRYFFLSMVAMSLFSTFSQMTYSDDVVSYLGLGSDIAMGPVRQQLVQEVRREYGRGTAAAI